MYIGGCPEAQNRQGLPGIHQCIQGRLRRRECLEVDRCITCLKASMPAPWDKHRRKMAQFRRRGQDPLFRQEFLRPKAKGVF